jgi:hypothetical protein
MQCFMSVCATDPRSSRERGTALVSTLVVLMGVFGLICATTITTSVEVRESRRALDQVRVQQVAEAGFEQGMRFIGGAINKTSAYHPLEGLTGLFATETTITPFLAEPLFAGGAEVGNYSVSITSVEQAEASITLRIDATGYLDAPSQLAPGEMGSGWHAVSVTVRYSLTPSQVFDYAYFINNWGWFYGNSIIANGSVRSNGQFDVANYSPWVNSQPLYDGVQWNEGNATLLGYRDDNGDGLADGNDGGVFSGWDTIRASNLRGSGGNADNQHDFQAQLEMPNLSNLHLYETLATNEGATITIDGSVVCDGVYGDDAGETGNLYLVGTAADPIVLDGPLVARGDVIISGYVTGQGAIYSGGNVYCPDSVQYVNPPATALPAGTTQAETEAWLTQNQESDFLGLFARENVVVGDHTHSTWRYHVNRWMSSSMNKSEEDAGEDGIPNTSAGRDGIHGTADDDVLEDDGVFSVEYYTEGDATLGLIPPGFAVGDIVPGSGEDIDGDGRYDGTTTLADIDFTIPLDSAGWGGNMPPGGIANYSDIATLYATNLDAVFYTNHSFCYTVLGGESAKINGALVSRNENIIYGTPSIEINYDCRLLGGHSGLAGGLLPQVMEDPQLLLWRNLDRDPNRYRVNP